MNLSERTIKYHDLGDACCTSASGTQALGDQMLQAMDTEIGRLLVATGVASRRHGGRLRYDPGASDTVARPREGSGTAREPTGRPSRPAAS